MKINYVIAAWTGPRTHEDLRQTTDRTFFIREQLDALTRCSHQLERITIILAGPGDELADQWIRALHRQSIASTPITVFDRNNYGFSYSSWNCAFEQETEEFDLWILTEDDYVPAVDAFDLILAIEQSSKGGYVCGLSNADHDHAAVSTAVISTSAWRKIHPLPSHAAEFDAQTFWSKAIHDRGVPVLDWTHYYSTPFWAGTELRWFGHPSNQPIFMPVQALHQEIEITDGHIHIPCTISEHGKVTPLTEEAERVWKTWQGLPLDSSCWKFHRMLK